MQKSTTNVKAKPDVVVSPADCLKHVVQLGKAVHTAALELCWSAAVYLLLVNFFKDSKDDGYMTKSDAVSFLQKEIAKQTGVKGRMLAQYVNTASQVAGILSGSPKMFADTIERLRQAPDSEAAAAILASWYEAAKNRRIESMRQLNESLGYAAPKPAEQQGLRAENVPERIENTLKAVEKIVSSGDKSGKKVQAATVTKAIVNAVPQDQTLSLIRQAIQRLTDETVLDVIEGYIKEQRQTLKRLATKAKEAVVEKAKEAKAKPTKKAKARKSVTVQTSA